MSSEAQERILSCPNLPSLPGVAVRILELTQNADVSLRDIAKVVEQDQALTGKILKTVNSSFYGLAQPCGTVDRALNYLGLTTVKSLVLGFSLVDSTQGVGEDTGFSLDQYWSRTIYSATAARLLALKFRRTDPDEAFTAALFQDIGILSAVTALGEEYIEAVGEALFRDDLPKIEQDKLGFTHTGVGSAIGLKWRLPSAYVGVIQHHHNPGLAPASAQQVVRIAVLGALSAEILSGGEGAPEAVQKFKRYVDEWYDETVEDIDQQLQEIAGAAKEIGKLFERKIESPSDTSALLSAAQERTIEIQFSSEREAMLDGLTGISNRKCFDKRSEAMFAAAREADTPIAVLFCDGDKFKSINDTLGHQAGDAVLVELAQRIKATVGDAGEAFRYGGEEFAIILPGHDIEQAAAVAESLRRAIADEPIDLSGVECGVDKHPQTISIGVAAGKPDSSYTLASMPNLVKAADEAVYKAKENGRNRVERAATAAKTPARAPAAPAPAGAASAATAAPPAAPAAPTDDEADATRVTPPAGGETRIRVLLVEDDPLSATLWRMMLLKSSGVEVAQASGRRGVEKLLGSGYAPDIVVTDYLLGSGTAVDVVLSVRRLMETPIPILVISAQLDSERQEAAMAAGATACASKAEVCKNFKTWIGRIVARELDQKRAAG